MKPKEPTKKVTIVLSSEEADILKSQANSLDISLNSLLRQLIFPDSHTDEIDRIVYKSIREYKTLTLAQSIKLSLQKHYDLPFTFRGVQYSWFERYDYIFLKYENKKDIYFPVAPRVLGKTGHESVVLILLSRMNTGEDITPSEFKYFYDLLDGSEHPDREDCYIISDFIFKRLPGRFLLIM